MIYHSIMNTDTVTFTFVNYVIYQLGCAVLVCLFDNIEDLLPSLYKTGLIHLGAGIRIFHSI